MVPDNELHSFPFSERVNGVEHNYRITQNGDRFGIERDGAVIAEISHEDHWVQLSGEPLSEDLLDKICYQIKSHYD